MKKLLFLSIVLIFSDIVLAQEWTEGWPHQLTQEEIDQAIPFVNDRGITTPPPYSNLRTMAEWEEVQSLVISWQGYNSILKKIVAAAKLECEVIILTESITTTTNYLTANNTGGPPLTLENVTMIQTNLDSVWERDFGANTVYGDEVDDLFLVDWIYNRPRPNDDVTPDLVAASVGVPIYSTTSAPYNLMNTGGNFMSDGFGTAFCSELVIMENQGGWSGWTNYPNHTEAEIDGIMNTFMGINTYIKMPVLPYDGIHHIDMHMKLLDEETILVSKYPDGIADGPQIEDNINYVLNNFTTKWGTPFKIIEIPAPPQQSNGNYPNNNGWYLTYANAVFINKTVILPTYYTQFDTTAIRIYEDALPGYNIVPIDCDNSSANIISASGAIHCITHTVGVSDPLLISYKLLEDTNNNTDPYHLQSYINHQSGVVSATLYYKANPEGSYSAVPMTYSGNNLWDADIPSQTFGTTVYYYVEAVAANGKVQRRPIVAPEGYKSFRVINEVFGCTNPVACNFDPEATIDNGSCILPDGCTDAFACNYNPNAICDDGTCQDGATYTVHILTDCWGEETSWNITDLMGTTIYNQPGGGLNDQTSFEWEICLDQGCFNFNILDSYGDGMSGASYGSCGVDGDYYITDSYGNVLVEMTIADFGSSETHNFCIPVEFPGCINISACNYDPDATIDDGSCSFPGCNDILACNYSPVAGCSDSTCTFPGCDDEAACNFDPVAGCNNGSCEYSSCIDPDCPGDFTNDGIVNTADMLILLGELGCTSTCITDLTGDDVVNTGDILLFLGYFGGVCP